MVTVSNDFKTAMKQPVKEIQAFIDYDDGSIKDSDDLISFKISCDSGLCKTAMRKLEAKYLGNHNVLGKWVRAVYGVRLPDGSFEYLDYGSFLVTELTVTKDTETTNIVAYDKMVNTMIPYATLNIEYPVSLIDYTRVLCDSCGLELGNSIFGRNLIKVTPRTHIVNGVTFVANADGGITVNGTATANADFYMIGKWENTTAVLSLDGTYRFTMVSNTDVALTGYLIYNTTVLGLVSKTNASGKYVLENKDISAIMFRVNAGTTIDNVTIYPILEKNANTDYVANYIPYNTMNDWQITATKDTDGNVIDLWENIEGITYRDIFVQIAQATGTTCVIGTDDKVYFKELTDTGESLTFDNMFKLKLEALYGEINSVVLARTPSEDNVYLQDEVSINTNGLTEFKIENNEIIDKNRETAITPIFNVLNGVCYYPFEATTEGLGWYEIADNIAIVNELGEEFKTSVFNYSITIDGSIKETLKATAESKTQTQYQYATAILKKVKNTEVIVNKQEQYIKQLVSDMYEENGVVNEKYTSIYQDIEKIVHSVQNSGGNNLIKNSVMFAHDNDKVPNWEIEGDGEFNIQSDTEVLNYGGASGHSFTLLNKIARQTIQVNGGGNNTYTFSSKIKKSATGSCYIKLYNTMESYVIEIPSGESAYYTDYEIKAVMPKENYYIIEFYGSKDSNATFTDNMLALGEIKSQWTQANGEVMNTQVNVSIDGVLVKSSVYAGDYTVMSPLEFAGYSNINGVPTRVFSLNKDVTEVEKLRAKAEITMTPIKIVPITEGDLQGWAFVPST